MHTEPKAGVGGGESEGVNCQCRQGVSLCPLLLLPVAIELVCSVEMHRPNGQRQQCASQIRDSLEGMENPESPRVATPYEPSFPSRRWGRSQTNQPTNQQPQRPRKPDDPRGLFSPPLPPSAPNDSPRVLPLNLICFQPRMKREKKNALAALRTRHILATILQGDRMQKFRVACALLHKAGSHLSSRIATHRVNLHACRREKSQKLLE